MGQGALVGSWILVGQALGAQALVRPHQPLRAPLDSCGRPWALVGWALVGRPLWALLGSCGPNWAFVGHALVGRALVGRAPLCRALVGPLGPYGPQDGFHWFQTYAQMGLACLYRYIYIYVYIYVYERGAKVRCLKAAVTE